MSTVALLSVLTLAGARAGAADGPRDLLRDGLLGIGAVPGLTATLSLDTDAPSLRAVLGADGTPVPDTLVQAVLDTSVRVTFPVAVPGDWFGMAVSTSGVDWAELRQVDRVAYLRMDLPAWLSLSGGDPAVLDELRAGLGGDALLPPDILEGRWVAVTEPDGVMAAAADDHGLGALGAALVDSPQVELAGSDELGDRLRVATSLRSLSDGLAADLAALAPGGAVEPGFPGDVPDELIELELWVRDGFLTGARLDLLQLGRFGPDLAMPPGVERMAVMVRFDPFEGSVPAPAGAVEIDGDRLMEDLLGGGLSPQDPGDSGSVGGGTPDAGTEPPGSGTARSSKPGAGALGRGGAAKPLTIGGLLGIPSGQPRPRPSAKGFPDAMKPDQALVDFYSRPGYGEARRRYCVQLDDVPDAVWARYFSDICPGA